jgi:glycerol-3-phosphate dehydrogenase
MFYDVCLPYPIYCFTRIIHGEVMQKMLQYWKFHQNSSPVEKNVDYFMLMWNSGDKILSALQLHRRENTRILAIGGGRDYPKDQRILEAWVDAIVSKPGLSAERVSALFERYGTRAESIASYLSLSEDAMLKYLPDYSQREIEFIAFNEKVIHLDDFFIRRTMLAKLGRLSLANIAEVAKIIGASLNWPAGRQSQEFRRTCEILKEINNVVPKGE